MLLTKPLCYELKLYATRIEVAGLETEHAVKVETLQALLLEVLTKPLCCPLSARASAQVAYCLFLYIFFNFFDTLVVCS